MSTLVKYIKVSMLMLLLTVTAEAGFTLNDDFGGTVEDTSYHINILANDTTTDGTVISIVAGSISQPSNGTVVFHSEGTVHYVPNSCYHGTETFTYSATDGISIATATVTITVSNVWNGTHAVNDTATTEENTQRNISVLENDNTMGGCGSLSVLYGSVTTPSNGTAVINANGTIRYTPNTYYHGTDTFTYTLTDGEELDTATVTVTVTPVNNTPIAVDDTRTTAEDMPVTIPVLINDYDMDYDSLFIDSITQPINGTAVINADDTITYRPNINYGGVDTFEYTVTDGSLTDTAVVTIDVITEDPMFRARNIHVETTEDTAVDIDLLANYGYGDTFSVGSITPPANGTVVMNANGTIRYTPNEHYHGTDIFTYTLTDGEELDTATVTVTVTPVNNAPIAVDDIRIRSEDVPVTIPVLINDIDVDGDSLSIVSITQPTNGTAVINADDTITYRPNIDHSGVDTFEYTVTDGSLTGTAVVAIVVEPLIVTPTLPDYKISLSTSTDIFFNRETNFTIILTVEELENGINSEDIVVTITKNDKISLTFYRGISTMHGKILSNNDWELTETHLVYRLKYIGNGKTYPQLSKMNIGLVGVFNLPASTRGEFSLSATLKDGTGDINLHNNEDIEIFMYTNVNN